MVRHAAAPARRSKVRGMPKMARTSGQRRSATMTATQVMADQTTRWASSSAAELRRTSG
jgi:hypothetical protein